MPSFQKQFVVDKQRLIFSFTKVYLNSRAIYSIRVKGHDQSVVTFSMELEDYHWMIIKPGLLPYWVRSQERKMSEAIKVQEYLTAAYDSKKSI